MRKAIYTVVETNVYVFGDNESIVDTIIIGSYSDYKKAREVQKECWSNELTDFIEIFGKDIETDSEDNKFTCAKDDTKYEIKIQESFLED